MNQKIKEIMSAVFSIDAAAWDENVLNRDNIEEWDSLSHLSLVTCLEEEFKVEIEPDEIPLLDSVAAITKILESHGALP